MKHRGESELGSYFFAAQIITATRGDAEGEGESENEITCLPPFVLQYKGKYFNRGPFILVGVRLESNVRYVIDHFFDGFHS